MVRAGRVIPLALLAVCARAKETGPAVCGPVSPKIVEAAGMPVYNACEVDVPVGESRALPINFWRPVDVGRTGCFHVAVDVVVDPSGHAVPGTATVVVNSDLNFLRAVFGVLPNIQFSAAIKGAYRVAQLVRLDKKSRIDYWVRTSTGYNPVFYDYPTC
ncbi:MAG TPA: hypothetical protein VF483_02520 [Gemmatimonadaceae bacterium]